MTTRILEAQSGRISQEIINVAKTEGVSPRFISEGIAKGQIVILKNDTYLFGSIFIGVKG